MAKKYITENEIELFNLELLANLGYDYRCGYDIQPEDSPSITIQRAIGEGERQTFADVVLSQSLENAVSKINPNIPHESLKQAIREVLNIASPDLISNNQKFHEYLTEGITVEYQKDGETRGEKVWLIDWQNPDNNQFLAVNQFTIIEDNHNRRPDIILFINGLPLVVIELKNPADKKADIYKAYNQLQTYKREIPSLFTYNALLIISDGLTARAGSLSANYNRFMAWKNPLNQKNCNTLDLTNQSNDKTSSTSYLVNQSNDKTSDTSYLVNQSNDKTSDTSYLNNQTGNVVKPNPSQKEENRTELEILTEGMLNKTTLLDLIRCFTVFEETKTQDVKTDIVTIKKTKKIAAYHQYYAVNKALESIKRACGISSSHTLGNGFKETVSGDRTASFNDSPEAEGLRKKANKGDRRGGVIWHTQGSGKSLSMVFLAGKLVLEPTLKNPTILVLTDRNDLDEQLFDTFAGCRQLLRQDPEKAENREEVQTLLKVASGGIVFSTIQKFAPSNNLSPSEENISINNSKETTLDNNSLENISINNSKETTLNNNSLENISINNSKETRLNNSTKENITAKYPTLSDRSNIIVLADEAHRSQYGFKAKQADVKDKSGKVIGKQTLYGFAKYIREALPHATFIGFTGTPIEQVDKNTKEVFGNYIDIYDIAQAVKDGATVPIYYESRLVKLQLDDQGKALLDELDEDLQFEDMNTTQKAKAKSTQIEAIVGATKRLETIAQDIVNHFGQRQKVNQGKGMIVTMSRRIAVDLYQQIIKILPDWHNKDLTKGKIKVVMTANASDEEKLVKHHTSKADRKILAQRLKDPENDLELVIVCDMWLTGFDAPCLHTMYIDKPLKGHNLMQAIARINRVYFEKQGGLIVDYLGLASELKKALTFYAESGGEGQPTLDQEVALGLLLSKIEIVEQLLHGCKYQDYSQANTREKLTILKNATDFACNPDIKERFLRETTALSKAYSLAVPHPQAIAQAEKISFFQAIQASIYKLEPSNNNSVSNGEIETAIRQIVDQAIVSDTVINIFEDAGIKDADISIISDEFIEEVRGMEHRNLAVELLQRLLKDEIKNRRKINLVQSRKLSEMLEDSLRRYHNHVISVTDVIEELLKISKDVTEADKRGEELGLEAYELAFYDALAQNDSAIDVMGVEELKRLAIALVNRIRQNASIDWNMKESVRARMKVMVKRLLRKYGYPPDMEALAIELVLEQAKVLTEKELDGN